MRRAAIVALLLGAWAIAQSGSPGYAAYQRGAALFDRGQYEQSLAEIDSALKLDARLVPALTLKAKLAMSINRYDVATECLEQALAVEPSASYAQFLLGFLHYRQNRMPEAVQALEKARRLSTSDARPVLYLGMAQETLGENAKALALYRDAIRLEEASGKPHADAWLACAKLMMVEGDLEGAGRLIEQALKMEPRSRDPHFEAGRLLLKKGKAAEAAKEGEIALGLRGEATDPQVHFLLVQAYRAAGREQEASAHAAAIREGERK